MTEPLNYLPQPKEPPAQWSWCAVVGFSLSVVGPVLGFFLASTFDWFFPDHLQLPPIILAPLVCGFTFSLLGALSTTYERTHLRGRLLAWAGVAIALGWGVFFVLLFVMFTTHMH